MKHSYPTVSLAGLVDLLHALEDELADLPPPIPSLASGLKAALLQQREGRRP